MNNVLKLSIITSLLLVACSDNNNDESVLGPELFLSVVDGTEIVAESLNCYYKQHFGAANTLALQLQYLSGPNEVAFSLLIDNPIPATPFVASAGQQGEFLFFLALTENIRFSNILTNGEIEVTLEDLPSPSALSDGDTIPLSGNLSVNQFTLTNETVSSVLASGSVDIDCNAEFHLIEMLN